MTKHIMDVFEQHARSGNGQFAIAYALMELTQVQKATAAALQSLGVGNAATEMGGLELLSLEVGKGGAAIAEAISGIDLSGSNR